MTGLEGNKQIYLPQEIQEPLPQEFLSTEAQTRSIELFGKVILKLRGQIDSPLLPEGPVIICFIIPLC